MKIAGLLLIITRMLCKCYWINKFLLPLPLPAESDKKEKSEYYKTITGLMLYKIATVL